MLFNSRHLNIIGWLLKFWIISDGFNHWFVVLSETRDSEPFLDLSLIEIALITLFLKVWVDNLAFDRATNGMLFEVSSFHVSL